jgi:hypothetical protein
MKRERYEWREINKELGCWGLWDTVKHEWVIETTKIGMETYKKLGF